MNNRIQTGMIVLADVRNPIENSNSRGKKRPVIVVERMGGQVIIVGLTTKARRLGDGAPRVAIPDPESLGLHGQGFLWSDRWHRVCALDVDRQIGWITPEVAELVCANVHLSSSQRQALREAALAHRRFDTAA